MVHIEPPWAGAAIGVTIYMFFRSTVALGANMQRYSLEKEATRNPELQRPKRRQPVLVAGVVLWTVSGVLLSIALIFAPQTLLSPCGVVIFVANALFAHYMNHETFSWRLDGPCILAIMVGVALCLVSAPKTEEERSKDELSRLCAAPTFVIFMFGLMFMIGVQFIARWALLRKMKFPECRTPLRSYALALCLGGVAGCLGGLNVTTTKSIFGLIEAIGNEDGITAVLRAPLVYIVGLGLAVSYAAQIRCTTDGLEKSSAMLFVPIQSVTEESVATLGGLIFFQEFRRFEAWSAIVFAVGMVTSISGVVSLTVLRIRRGGSNVLTLVADEMEEVVPLAAVELTQPLQIPGDAVKDGAHVVDADNLSELTVLTTV